MTENVENLILEQLRHLRNDMLSFRTETRDALNRLDLRRGLIEQSLASLITVDASDRDELRSMKLRIERIEKRLELTDAP